LLLIFIVLFLFYLTMFPYTIIFIVLFDKKVTAIVAGVLFYFVSFFLIFVTTADYLSSITTKKIFSLFPSISFTNILSILGM